tara:strand:- start:1487 stop:2896 length:1410 start_codon:yes stop_codon:yes gene_type:complete
MLFNSLEFAVFLPVVFIIYWLITQKHLNIQNTLLVIASYIFYGWWDWRFLTLIIFSTIIDYKIGIELSKEKKQFRRKILLWVSLIVNLGFLGFFKYFNFFLENFVNTFTFFGFEINSRSLNIILPVGISFYTFQTLSYTIDIYRNKINPTKDFIAFSAFVSFFPQLVAGPIERASSLLPQICKKRIFSKLLFREGIVQIFVGLFKKIVIADNLGKYVDIVYGNIAIYDSSTIFLATFFYTFQIYYDFSGYSDIAIGTAKLFGIKFKQNFNLPYFSKSLTEFWRKWHISLSSWLRDYLYISLGGNRKGIKITYRNLMITMLLGGLWHGSSWNFIIWGGIHGIVLSIEKYLKFEFKKNFSILGLITTFAVVLFSWIFFRAQNLDIAFLAIKKIFIFNFNIPFIGDQNIFLTILFALSTGLVFDYFLYIKKIKLENLGSKFSIYKTVFFCTLIIIILNLFYSSSNNFIYFQF